MTNKLTLPVESRMQGDLHVRFGGRLWETYHRKVVRRPSPSLPVTGISLMKVIPPVRNKVNTTDLIGPSSQAFWADGEYGGGITLKFE